MENVFEEGKINNNENVQLKEWKKCESSLLQVMYFNLY